MTKQRQLEWIMQLFSWTLYTDFDHVADIANLTDKADLLYSLYLPAYKHYDQNTGSFGTCQKLHSYNTLREYLIDDPDTMFAQPHFDDSTDDIFEYCPDTSDDTHLQPFKFGDKPVDNGTYHIYSGNILYDHVQATLTVDKS